MSYDNYGEYVSFFNNDNARFDRFFYDLSVLTPEEETDIGNHTKGPDRIKDGSVIVVKPKRLRISEESKELECYFLAENVKGSASEHKDELEDIDTVVVAGVGSSVFGTAALAKKVAEISNKSVAGIVSGYGFNNVSEEALQGWFDLGRINIHRHNIACSIYDGKKQQDILNLEKKVNEIPEMIGLNTLLTKYCKKVEKLIGHSKGNLIIASTLYNLLVEKTLDNELRDQLEKYRVLTLGAVVYFPEEFKQVYQYIGSQDNFGFLNSRWWCIKHGMSCIKYNTILNAWHHLNPNRFLPFTAMPFERIFREVFPT